MKNECFENLRTTNDWLIGWIEFYAVSAMFQPCNGGRTTNAQLMHNQPTMECRNNVQYRYLHFILSSQKDAI